MDAGRPHAPLLRLAASTALAAIACGRIGYDGLAANRDGGSVVAAASVAGGGGHACVVTTGGEVACWGNNARGQVGDGTRTTREAPVLVAGLADAVQVAAGEGFTCARQAAGSVWCWGSNSGGTLGDGGGSGADRPRPGQVVGVTDAIDLDAGEFGVCVAHASGAVSCWGSWPDSQSGDCMSPGFGSSSITTPQTVNGVTSAVGVAVGASHRCAVSAAGQLSCWGANHCGQLGDGTMTFAGAPLLLTSLANVVEVAAKHFHTCARLESGEVSCWGRNDDGQLGDGTQGGPRLAPAPAPLFSPAADLAMGQDFTCAARTTGTIRCAGVAVNGQLGDGGAGGDVVGITDAIVVGAGTYTAYAIRADGQALAWGSAGGALGDGGGVTAYFSDIPVVVALP